MNTGVEILLKRMETHPEDFDYQPQFGSVSRWMRLVDHAIGDELVTEEEEKALKLALKEVKRQRFTELVMKELAGVDEESNNEGKIYYASPISPWGTSTLASNSLTLGNTTIQEEQLKMMKEILKREKDNGRK